MQDIKQTLLLLLISVGAMLMACTSCNKDNNNQREASVTALVDGVAWQASPNGPHSPVAAVAIRNTALNIIIQAYASDGSYISLNVITTSAIVENVDYTEQLAAFQGQFKPSFLENDSYSTVLPGASGTLRFTNISASNVSGTFSFNGVKQGGGSVIVHNGSFDVDL